jgi:hypothetical protein
MTKHQSEPNAQPASESATCAVCPWCDYRLPLPGEDYRCCPRCYGSFSFRKPVECGCVRCLEAKPVTDGYPIPHHRRRMVVCPTCGNKRCPKAEYHGYVCSGSNDTGQTPAAQPASEAEWHTEDALSKSTQHPASEPSGREAVYAKHRKRCERECTRDVIFVFQRRRLRWTGRLPDGYEFRDSFVFLKGDGRVAEPQTLEAIYAAHGSEYAIETWDVESVWLDRDEAEAWAKAHEYNYRDGWRVYGMPADGELAKLLRGEHESQRHPAAPAGEREDNTALQAKLDAVTGLEKKWRAWSRGIGKSPVAAQWAYTRCADELESALAGGGK